MSRLTLADIRLRDPFIVFDATADCYLMTGTVPGKCDFPLYTSFDLTHWEALPDCFTPPAEWASMRDYWAPEIHRHGEAWYLLATVKPTDGFRATWSLRANQAAGPYAPVAALTPPRWECLDGTLWIEDGQPWLVFCREWTQVHDGGMWAAPLGADLDRLVGRPVWLFDASEAPWACPCDTAWSERSYAFPCYITDGPWLQRLDDGTLILLWSSFGANGAYMLGSARAASGSVTGPWQQDSRPLITTDGGHGMSFRDRQGTLQLCLHQPNTSPHERPRLLPLTISDQEFHIP